MKTQTKTLILFLTLSNLSLFAASVTGTSHESEQASQLPVLSFKQALRIVTMLVIDVPMPADTVKTFMRKLESYKLAESQLEPKISLKQKAHRSLTKIVADVTFRDVQDLNLVIEAIRKETDAKTANSIEEEHRDLKLIFNPEVAPVAGSETYARIKTIAQEYHKRLQELLIDKENYTRLEASTADLKQFMQEFLEQHYENLEHLKATFERPVNNATQYLALQIKKQ